MLSTLGINCNGSFNSTYIADSVFLKNFGFKKIRIAIDSYTGDHTLWRLAGAYLKSLGVYTIYGISAGANTITSANWSTYAAAVIAEATYCQANAICDEFQIGNELENATDGTLNNTSLYNNLVTLTASVKAVFSGKVSYTFSGSNPGVWNTNASLVNANINFDKIGSNIYGAWNDRASFITYINNHTSNYPSKGYFSEFGLDSDWGNVPSDQEFQAQELSVRIVLIKNSGMDAYFYNWQESDDQFAVKLQDGTFRIMWCSL